MKFLKKSGIYFALVLMTLILSIYGYVSESRKSPSPPPEEITYIPEVEHFPTSSVEVAQETAIEEDVKAAKVNTAPIKQELTYSPPVTGMISLPYSETDMTYSKTMGDFRTHTAVDYVCNADENILSSGEGIVSKVYEDAYLGLCIFVSHPDGVLTKYCALKSVNVKEGDVVDCGTALGIAGNSAAIESEEGIHLHFEAEKEGKRINPLTLFPSL